jgi:hypothetical protein
MNTNAHSIYCGYDSSIDSWFLKRTNTSNRLQNKGISYCYAKYVTKTRKEDYLERFIPIINTSDSSE